MRSFVLFLLTCIAFSSFAGVIRGVGSSYAIVKEVRDASVPAGKTSVRFQAWGASSKTIPHRTIDYLLDNEHLSAKTDGSGVFSLTAASGKHVFLFDVSEGEYEGIYTDSIAFKSGYRVEINLYFSRANMIMEKPVIYLYPETEQAVSVQLEPAGVLQFTYPAYADGWNLNAAPDGTLTQNGRSYPYLFWEAQTDVARLSPDVHEGFVVERAHVIAFLEEHLAAIGLNSTEQTDFITYWGPRMVSSEQVFVQFVWNDQADRFGKLLLSPQPDHVNRLYLLWTALNEPLPKLPAPQSLPVFDRSGFDVLEWGGSEIPAATLLSFTSSAAK